MRVTPILFGIYADIGINGQFAVVIGDKIATERGLIDLPPVTRPADGTSPVMFTRLAPDGRIAVKSHDVGEVWVWSWDSGWTNTHLLSHGVQGHIFTPDGQLHVVTPGPDVNSQGWRYYDPQRGLIDGGVTYNSTTPLAHELGVKGLWEWTHRDGITVGQGETGLVIQHPTYGHRMLQLGDTHFVQFHKSGSRLAIATSRLAERDALLFWLDEAEIASLPVYTIPGPVVVEPPVDPPIEPPDTEPEMPESLESAVRAERAKYPVLLTIDQPAKILNAVAWAHRADGWGLSVKKNGNNVPSPQGVPVAYDILHHKPTDTLWGCGTGEWHTFTVNWGLEDHHHNPERPWLAPIQPADGPIEEPEDPPEQPDYSAQFAEIRGRLDALTATVITVHDVALEAKAKAEEALNKPPVPPVPPDLSGYVARGKVSLGFLGSKNVELPVVKK